MFNAVDVMDVCKIDCKITTEDLKILYKTHCIYENGTGDKKELENQDSTYCDKCLLRNIEWTAAIKEWQMIDKTYKDSGTIIRDLCFAIWHDDILNKQGKEIAFCG